ncbi:MAG TPA: DUF1844 domain-containing protein, partial [Terriglobales bacterium]|nr:DUF1844 domain-containing protein [Terriglobales bacterium]
SNSIVNNMAEKKPDFVVSDRRKFTEEGELRTEVRDESPSHSSQSSGGSASAIEDEMPPAPTHAEQEAQHSEYRASGKKLDDILAAGGHGKAEDFEMSFDRLVQSLYVTAMLQLGVMHREGENPQPDIIGARQTIDTLGVLKEKTKGNLTPQEENLLQNVLFELRMAFLELTNAITRAPNPAAGKPAAK